MIAPKHIPVRGILLIAATYIYFLLFAQFGLVHLVQECADPGIRLDVILAAMGAAGIAASLGAGAALGRIVAAVLQRWGFAGCAAAALAALPCRGTAAFAAVAALAGASTAVLTVSLAASMRDALGGRRFGLSVGLGTGTAYLVCNMPYLFGGSGSRQAVASALVCLAAALWPKSSPSSDEPTHPGLPSHAFHGIGFAAVIMTFLALIWLDSAAFATIQETLALKGTTWGTPGRQWLMGLVHFAGAIAAGRMIDQGRFALLAPGAFLLFVVGLSSITAEPQSGIWAGPLYAIGISAYSTALVAYPSLRGDEAGLVPRRWRAAGLFGVSGWIGSALGVGMAQDLHGVPAAFLIGAGALIAAGTALLYPDRPLRWIRANPIPIAFGAAAVLVLPMAGRVQAILSNGLTPVEWGRRVYIHEGCINCHTQYVRPNSQDEEVWGPFAPPDETGQPPLIGARRQGPDLQRVGARRSPDWQRIHLMNPRGLNPLSRMPSYAHLFADDGLRGDALIAYLQSLGADAAAERLRNIDAWTLPAAAAGTIARGQQVFLRSCAPCHGDTAAGDGPLAESFRRPTMDLRKPSLAFVPPGLSESDQRQAVARIVRFGISGTPMPGHETLPNDDIDSLVRFLKSLSAPSSI